MKEKAIKEKLYFQDFPVNDFKDDYVGVEAEVEMLKESVESDSKIIGLISEYGSGKSSIIELLKKSLDKDKYDIVNINLLDTNGINNDLEAHKRMLVQLANHKYKDKKNKKKLSYITKRLNSNYKSIDITTTSNSSAFWIFLSIFFFVIKFLYKNDVLSYINFLSYSKCPAIIGIIKELCNLSGFIGFAILFIVVIKSELICNYLKNGDNQTLNEFDLIEISKQLIDEEKITVIIIEDLDRLENTKYMEEFIKEINTYYKSMDNSKFIIALTPEEFYEMSKGKTLKMNVDNKYKPFNVVIELPTIKNSDYVVILNELLLSKKTIFKKSLSIDIEQTLSDWYWLSFGKNMNIRRLKHRINSVIHLYKTLLIRFPGKYIELKTCIAVVYLKDEYEQEYEQLINDETNEFKLKQYIERIIKENVSLDSLSGIEYDLYKLTTNGYIDYNCEMYCFNYSKHNKIFDVYEYELINNLMYDRKLKLADSRIENIIKNNPSCIKDILEKRLSLNMGLPLNIFDSKSLINYLYDSNEDMVKEMCKELLPIDNDHIKNTVSRLKKIKGTNFFNEENLNIYIKDSSNKLQEDGNVESINQIRLNLLEVIDNALNIKELYENNYSIITQEEMKKIGNLSYIIKLIDYSKVNLNNISYIVEMIDYLYTEEEKEQIINIVDKFNDEIIDYYFKNCKSLSKLANFEKEKLLKENKNRLNLTNLLEIERLINNLKYSIEELENKVIELLNSGMIDISQYKDFINILPCVHICTLKRIEKDDFNFKISDLIINEFEKNKEYFGYVKFKTINDNKIPSNNKKYYKQYEALYSNENHIFDKYMNNNIAFLKYISDNKIYEKYSTDRFMIMSNYAQSDELLNYAFDKLEDQQMLNDYLFNINSINCNKIMLTSLINKNKPKKKNLSKSAYNNFIHCCKDRSIKSKLGWIRKK